LLREAGQLGFLATNTIAQGETREVGLDQVVGKGCVIPRAVPSRAWPGEASLEVALLWIRKGNWSNAYRLADNPASGITSFLTEPGTLPGTPYPLRMNAAKAFQGSVVLGMGFVMRPEDAQRLIDSDARNQQVLFPYLNGDDLNSRPDQSASRWIINFFDWPLDHDAAPQNYDGPVAADFPDCLAIVREKVKPERDKLGTKKDASAQGYAKFWWQYGRKGIELYRTIDGMEQVLVRSRVAELHSIAAVPSKQVLNERLTVFAFRDHASFAILQSSVHEVWARRYSGTLRTDMMYVPTDCFETFSFPNSSLASGCRLVG
jgi:hypothetical protein